MSQVVIQGYNGPLVITQGYLPSTGPPGPGPSPGPGTMPGGNCFSALGPGLTVVLLGFKMYYSRPGMNILVHAAGTGTFNLDQYQAADGATSVLTKQIASAAVFADGTISTYTQSAELYAPVGYLYWIGLTNTDVVPIDFCYEYREVQSAT